MKLDYVNVGGDANIGSELFNRPPNSLLFLIKARRTGNKNAVSLFFVSRLWDIMYEKKKFA